MVLGERHKYFYPTVGWLIDNIDIYMLEDYLNVLPYQIYDNGFMFRDCIRGAVNDRA